MAAAACDLSRGNFFLCVFISVCFSAGLTVSEEDLGSPLRTAQCRAGCVNKFPVVPLKLSSCLQDTECNMCWENCQLLESFPAFEAICSKSSVCFAGCQEACKFHSESWRNGTWGQRAPVEMTTGERVLSAEASWVRWPRPRGAPSSSVGALVYVVLRRAPGPGRGWRQLEQTPEQAARVAPDPGAGALRVLAVNRTGLVAIYSPQARPRLEGADIIMRSLGRAGLFADPQLKAGRRINTPVSRLSTTNPLKLLAGSENTQSSPSLWNLREISLIHQRVLVIAEIAWDARKGAPSTTPTPGSGPGPVVYLVTWEIDGGGLKGNLFTNSTCVTLSLWPDTVCHIKVEVYDSKQRSRPDQSEELVLDTHRVSRAESEEAPSAAPSSAPLSQAAPPTGAPGRNRSIQIWAVESELGERRVERLGAERDSLLELVLGATLAVILFLGIVASLALSHRRRAHLAAKGAPFDAAPAPEVASLVHQVRELPSRDQLKRPPPGDVAPSFNQGPVPVTKFLNSYSSWMTPTLPIGQSDLSFSGSGQSQASPVATHLVNAPLGTKLTSANSSVNFYNPNQTESVS
nr:PREDICTED: uncharacterized protein LOC109044362 [Bemisia tabaci]